MNSSKQTLIKFQVITRIERGDYKAGARIPADTEIAREFGVSKETVVKAFKELVGEGHLFRRRGSGTYVRIQRIPPIVPGRKFRVAIAWKDRVFPGKLRDDQCGIITRALLKELGLNHLEPEWTDASYFPIQTWAKWDAQDCHVSIHLFGPSEANIDDHPLLSLFKEEPYDAIVTIGINQHAWLAQLLGLGIPTLTVDYCSRKFDQRADQIFYDSTSSYQTAVHFLLSRGKTNIHFLGGLIHPPLAFCAHLSVPEAKQQKFQDKNQMIEPDTHPRLSAFRQAMEEAGRPVAPNGIHYGFLGDAPIAFAEKMAKEEDGPDAFICHSISQASTIVDTYRRLGKEMVAVGAGSLQNPGSGIQIQADPLQLGRTVSAILVSRLRQPDRLPLRVGVPLQFPMD